MAKATNTPPGNTPVDKEAQFKAIKKMFEGDAIVKRFEQILGKNASGFIMSVLQIISNEKKLQVAEITSIYNAAAKAAVIKLPLDTNLQYACIVPYKDTKSGITYAQFQMQWKGFVQLAQRTGQYKTINVVDVREGELINEDLLTGDCTFKWEQDYDKRQALNIIGYVSFFELVAGFRKMIFWREEKLRKHAKKYSKTYDFQDGRWNTDFEAMCKKTMIKENLSKWGPLSIELSDAIKYDQAVVGDDGKPNYIDNPLTEYEELSDEEAEKIAEEERQRQAKAGTDDLFNKMNPETNKK